MAYRNKKRNAYHQYRDCGSSIWEIPHRVLKQGTKSPHSYCIGEGRSSCQHLCQSYSSCMPCLLPKTLEPQYNRLNHMS